MWQADSYMHVDPSSPLIFRSLLRFSSRFIHSGTDRSTPKLTIGSKENRQNRPINGRDQKGRPDIARKRVMTSWGAEEWMGEMGYQVKEGSGLAWRSTRSSPASWWQWPPRKFTTVCIRRHMFLWRRKCVHPAVNVHLGESATECRFNSYLFGAILCLIFGHQDKLLPENTRLNNRGGNETKFHSTVVAFFFISWNKISDTDLNIAVILIGSFQLPVPVGIFSEFQTDLFFFLFLNLRNWVHF